MSTDGNEYTGVLQLDVKDDVAINDEQDEEESEDAAGLTVDDTVEEANGSFLSVYQNTPVGAADLAACEVSEMKFEGIKSVGAAGGEFFSTESQGLSETAPDNATPDNTSLEQTGADGQVTSQTSGAHSDDDRSFKIFVGGLSRGTNGEILREYFGQFGPIIEAEVLFDKLTGRSRGFGFVKFQESAHVDAVVDKHHTIDNSQVEVRRAIPREEARQNQGGGREDVANDGSGRIFIGGLGDEVTEELLREHFGQFGEILSVNVMIDKQTNKPRGFGFVIFKNPDDSEKALGPHKELGSNCEAKRAQPRNQNRTQQRVDPRYGYRMSIGDGRYGRNRDYDYMAAGYGGINPAAMYGGYGYAYHPYYAAYYAQSAEVAAAYGAGYGGYGHSPGDQSFGSQAGPDRGSRSNNNRSAPY